MIKGSIHQENIIIVNVFVPNIKHLPYIKQTLADLNGEIESNIIMKQKTSLYDNRENNQTEN